MLSMMDRYAAGPLFNSWEMHLLSESKFKDLSPKVIEEDDSDRKTDEEEVPARQPSDEKGKIEP